MKLKWVRKYVDVSDVPFIADKNIRELDVGDCILRETDGRAMDVTDGGKTIAQANLIGRTWIAATHDERGKWVHQHRLSKSQALEVLAMEGMHYSIAKWEEAGIAVRFPRA